VDKLFGRAAVWAPGGAGFWGRFVTFRWVVDYLHEDQLPSRNFLFQKKKKPANPCSYWTCGQFESRKPESLDIVGFFPISAFRK
jgi:hypothetical protein